MIGQEHYPILNNCVFNWSLGSIYIIYMLLISWAIVQFPYNDNDKIRYKIIQSWQYISFQQRDWWCNITLYWLLKRLFQLYSTGERQTKGERRFFLRLKPIVYVYDNVYDTTKKSKSYHFPWIHQRGIQMEEECFHCQSWNYLASSNQVWAWLQSAIEFTIASPLEFINHFIFFLL